MSSRDDYAMTAYGIIVSDVDGDKLYDSFIDILDEPQHIGHDRVFVFVQDTDCCIGSRQGTFIKGFDEAIEEKNKQQKQIDSIIDAVRVYPGLEEFKFEWLICLWGNNTEKCFDDELLVDLSALPDTITIDDNKQEENKKKRKHSDNDDNDDLEIVAKKQKIASPIFIDLTLDEDEKEEESDSIDSSDDKDTCELCEDVHDLRDLARCKKCETEWVCIYCSNKFWDTNHKRSTTLCIDCIKEIEKSDESCSCCGKKLYFKAVTCESCEGENICTQFCASKCGLGWDHLPIYQCNKCKEEKKEKK